MTASTVPRYPRLTALLEEAFPEAPPPPDPEARLLRCLAGRGGSERARIAEEADTLLRRGLCDMQLADLLAFELGCHLRPAEMGMTPAAWLAWVRRHAAAQAPRPAS